MNKPYARVYPNYYNTGYASISLRRTHSLFKEIEWFFFFSTRFSRTTDMTYTTWACFRVWPSTPFEIILNVTGEFNNMIILCVCRTLRVWALTTQSRTPPTGRCCNIIMVYRKSIPWGRSGGTSVETTVHGSTRLDDNKTIITTIIITRWQSIYLSKSPFRTLRPKTRFTSKRFRRRVACDLRTTRYDIIIARNYVTSHTHTPQVFFIHSPSSGCNNITSPPLKTNDRKKKIYIYI